jgi:hypothetical protein
MCEGREVRWSGVNGFVIAWVHNAVVSVVSIAAVMPAFSRLLPLDSRRR